MADPRFFHNSGPKTLKELAEIAGGELAALDCGNMVISDLASLEEEEETASDKIAVLHNRKYLNAFKESAVGACLVSPEFADQAPKGMGVIVCAEPHYGFALIANAFYPTIPAKPGVHPSAIVDEAASVGEGVCIEAGAVIAAGVSIGPGCRIGPNTVISENVEIGAGCDVGPNVTLSHCLIGRGVMILPGARIGQDGFGFAISKTKGFLSLPQLGRVIVGDGVSIGANTTIDRGAGPDTVIGAGSRIDNLVQLGHNVELGQGCVVVAQVGVSGSTKFGNYVQAGGQAGFAGHLKIGDGAKISAQAGVAKDIPAGQTVAGYPARPSREFWRMIAKTERMLKSDKK